MMSWNANVRRGLVTLPRGSEDERWMAEALVLAEDGLVAGELPIGAIVVVDREVVGRAHTQDQRQRRMLPHAELLALDEADRVLGRRRRQSATLYTNVEPCLLCLGAAVAAMLGAVVYGLDAPGDGAVRFARAWDEQRERSMTPDFRLPDIRSGVLEEASAALFDRYVAARPHGGYLVAWARALTRSQPAG